MFARKTPPTERREKVATMASMTRRHAAAALVLVALVACVAADDKPRLPARVRPVGAQSRAPLSAQFAAAHRGRHDIETTLEQGRKHARRRPTRICRSTGRG